MPEGQDVGSDEEEVYAFQEGQLPEGQVLGDLEGTAEDGYESDMDEEAEDHEHPTEVPDDSVHCFDGHTESVFCVAWNPVVPGMVATGGGDDKAFRWTAGQDAEEYRQSGMTTHALVGHTDSVATAEFNPLGTLLATGGLDGRVKVWEVQSGSCIQTLEGPGEGIEWAHWHPKGNVIVAGSEDMSVWMWNADNGAFMQVFTGHSGPVRCGSFTPDGRSIVTGGGEGDCSLRVWNPKTGECSTVIHGHGFHEQGLTALALHPTESVALTGSEDGSARLSNIQTGKVVATLAGHDESIEAVAFSQALNVAVTASMDGKMMVWDNLTATLRATCEHPEGVVRLSCHPTQPFVYTGCLDGLARCWDLRTGECVRTRSGHTEGIQALALNSDGTLLLTGSDDHTARVFNF